MEKMEKMGNGNGKGVGSVRNGITNEESVCFLYVIN